MALALGSGEKITAGTLPATYARIARSSAANRGRAQVLLFARIATAAATNTRSVRRALNGNRGQSTAIVARKRSSSHRRMTAAYYPPHDAKSASWGPRYERVYFFRFAAFFLAGLLADFFAAFFFA